MRLEVKPQRQVGNSSEGHSDDEVNDTAIMIIEGSCPSVPNSMILKRELYLL